MYPAAGARDRDQCAIQPLHLPLVQPIGGLRRERGGEGGGDQDDTHHGNSWKRKNAGRRG